MLQLNLTLSTRSRATTWWSRNSAFWASGWTAGWHLSIWQGLATQQRFCPTQRWCPWETTPVGATHSFQHLPTQRCSSGTPSLRPPRADCPTQPPWRAFATCIVAQLVVEMRRLPSFQREAYATGLLLGYQPCTILPLLLLRLSSRSLALTQPALQTQKRRRKGRSVGPTARNPTTQSDILSLNLSAQPRLALKQANASPGLFSPLALSNRNNALKGRSQSVILNWCKAATPTRKPAGGASTLCAAACLKQKLCILRAPRLPAELPVGTCQFGEVSSQDCYTAYPISLAATSGFRGKKRPLPRSFPREACRRSLPLPLLTQQGGPSGIAACVHHWRPFAFPPKAILQWRIHGSRNPTTVRYLEPESVRIAEDVHPLRAAPQCCAFNEVPRYSVPEAETLHSEGAKASGWIAGWRLSIWRNLVARLLHCVPLAWRRHLGSGAKGDHSQGAFQGKQTEEVPPDLADTAGGPFRIIAACVHHWRPFAFPPKAILQWRIHGSRNPTTVRYIEPESVRIAEDVHLLRAAPQCCAFNEVPRYSVPEAETLHSEAPSIRANARFAGWYLRFPMV